MKLTNFIITTIVVIAAMFSFGAQGFPRPQNDQAVKGPALAMRPLPTRPRIRGTTTVRPTRSTRSPIVTPTTSTMRPEIAQCIRNCPTTAEYNPVCGSNGVMYNNPGRLMCASFCGINVTQIRSGRC